jgi:hypothetical protein
MYCPQMALGKRKGSRPANGSWNMVPSLHGLLSPAIQTATKDRGPAAVNVRFQNVLLMMYPKPGAIVVITPCNSAARVVCVTSSWVAGQEKRSSNSRPSVCANDSKVLTLPSVLLTTALGRVQANRVRCVLNECEQSSY